MADMHGLFGRWCPGAELNHRHTDFQSVALPTELPGRSASGAYRRSTVILSSRALLRRRLALGLLKLAAGGVALLPGTAADAQTDEIQVYDAEINNPGVFSLQLHDKLHPVRPAGSKQLLFAVVDYKSAPLSVEFGIGHGFTAASDPLVLKLILSHDL